jgi:hypothetical protein
MVEERGFEPPTPGSRTKWCGSPSFVLSACNIQEVDAAVVTPATRFEFPGADPGGLRGCALENVRDIFLMLPRSAGRNFLSRHYGVVDRHFVITT